MIGPFLQGFLLMGVVYWYSKNMLSMINEYYRDEFKKQLDNEVGKTKGIDDLKLSSTESILENTINSQEENSIHIIHVSEIVTMDDDDDSDNVQAFGMLNHDELNDKNSATSNSYEIENEKSCSEINLIENQDVSNEPNKKPKLKVLNSKESYCDNQRLQGNGYPTQQHLPFPSPPSMEQNSLEVEINSIDSISNMQQRCDKPILNPSVTNKLSYEEIISEQFSINKATSICKDSVHRKSEFPNH